MLGLSRSLIFRGSRGAAGLSWSVMQCFLSTFGAAHPRHQFMVRFVVSTGSPEVNKKPFFLSRIQGEIIISATHGQLVHLFTVVSLIVVADETYHSCLVSTFYEVNGAVGWLSTHPCGARVLCVMVLDVLLPTWTACDISVKKCGT